MTQLEDLEELLGISFNEEDYDTINGYLIDCLDRIPSEDEECQVEFGGYLFHVLSVDIIQYAKSLSVGQKSDKIVQLRIVKILKRGKK